MSNLTVDTFVGADSVVRVWEHDGKDGHRIAGITCDEVTIHLWGGYPHSEANVVAACDRMIEAVQKVRDGARYRMEQGEAVPA